MLIELRIFQSSLGKIKTLFICVPDVPCEFFCKSWKTSTTVAVDTLLPVLGSCSRELSLFCCALPKIKTYVILPTAKKN